LEPARKWRTEAGGFVRVQQRLQIRPVLSNFGEMRWIVSFLKKIGIVHQKISIVYQKSVLFIKKIGANIEFGHL
jgi:hypothetical protein